jgi:selenocysteine-specific elongation factor
VIVGTAGHIDHGKTALVRALTGVDTDRLPEEKARGITIDLGYAYAPLAETVTGAGTPPIVGFVDVPGHEQLVRTMVAGATGIDFALLVVAVDDGVMPQTIEHLNILTLLGVTRGVVALTKIDLADTTRVEQVAADVRALLASTSLMEAALLPVSTRTGEGIASLRATLASAANAVTQRPPGAASRGAFRLAVDRSFTLAGAGTVVTGSVHSGRVAQGARLTVVPANRPVRLRELHAQNRAASETTVGERSALNLADIARGDIARGDWVVDPAVALATQRLDARCIALPGAGRALRSGASVHLYVGAAHVTARVIALAPITAGGAPTDASTSRKKPASSVGDETLLPGVPTFVQLVTQAPIAGWHGDHFIVRDAGDAHTVGGGIVLDPFAPARYRRTPARLAVLNALAEPDARLRLTALLDLQDEGVDLAQFARASVCLAADIELPIGVHRIRQADLDHALTAGAWQRLQDIVRTRLATFHAQHADEMGPDHRRLQRIALPRIAPAVFAALIDDALTSGLLRQTGPWLHLPEHDNRLSPAEQALFDTVIPGMRAHLFDPPWVRDHAGALGQPEAAVRTVLNRAAKRGAAFQVVRDLFYHPQAVRELADIAAELQQMAGGVTATAFRDRTGLGRKRAIQVLEFFDRLGYTRRVADVHHVRGDALRRIGTKVQDLDSTLAMQGPGPAGTQPERQSTTA